MRRRTSLLSPVLDPVFGIERLFQSHPVFSSAEFPVLVAAPFMIIVAVTAEGLAAWRHDVQSICVVSAGAIIGFLLLMRVIVHQILQLDAQNTLLGQTAATLRESEEKAANQARIWQATLENMDQGLMLIDSERRVAVCNRRAVELMDLPADMMAARPKFEDVLTYQWQRDNFTDNEAELRAFVQRALQPDRPRIYKRERPNGRVVEVRTITLPEGEILRTFADVTEQQRALEALVIAKERAEGANRAKSAFLANISHELRTPLNAVIGFSDLLREQAAGPLNTTYVSYADDIHAGGVNLLNMVNYLIDLSRLEAGRYDLVEEEVNMATMMEACARLLTAQTAAEDIRILLDPGLGDVTLRIDRRAVNQVLLNLLSNAITSSPAGSTVTVEAEGSANAGVDVCIGSTGLDANATQVPSLLNAFRQNETDVVRDFSGIGLSLGITRKIMVLHGGDLKIEAKAGGGVLMTASFPSSRLVHQTPVTTDGIPL